MVPFVVVSVHRFARAPLAGAPSRRRPPRRAARRRRHPSVRSSALDEFPVSPASSQANPRAESCLLGRNRASSPEFGSAPPLSSVTAAARAPPLSPQRRQPSDLDPMVRIRSDRSQYRSNPRRSRHFAKKPLCYLGFASRSFRSCKVIRSRSSFFRFKP